MSENKLVLDFDQLKMLSGDDDEFMIEILEMIADQSPDIIEKMDNLYENADFQNLGATAHLYKSTVTILGNEPMNALLKDIENTARDDQDAQALLPLMESFRSNCNDILAQVKEQLAKLK
ncbi:MAG: Hpt domain-containing protein [Bacteroidota bacterium]